MENSCKNQEQGLTSSGRDVCLQVWRREGTRQGSHRFSAGLGGLFPGPALCDPIQKQLSVVACVIAHSSRIPSCPACLLFSIVCFDKCLGTAPLHCSFAFFPSPPWRTEVLYDYYFNSKASQTDPFSQGTVSIWNNVVITF